MAGELDFEIDYKEGKRNGEGKEYYDNGEVEFEGKYLDGERNGEGKGFYKNGKLDGMEKDIIKMVLKISKEMMKIEKERNIMIMIS